MYEIISQVDKVDAGMLLFGNDVRLCYGSS